MRQIIYIIFLIAIVLDSSAMAAVYTVDSHIVNIFINNKKTDSLCNSNNFISAKESIAALKLPKNNIFIDVRNKDDFASYRIPQSLNIPLFAIKTKNNLKKKKIILINKGFDTGSLEDECEKLRRVGFENIFVLLGGLKSWRDNGGRIEGDYFAMKTIDFINPRQLAVKRNLGYWKAVNFAVEKSVFLEKNLGLYSHIPLLDDSRIFVDQVEKLSAKVEEDCRPHTVMISVDGDGYERVKGVIQENGLRGVYFLQGGLNNFQEFIKDHKAILDSNEQREKVCNTCS